MVRVISRLSVFSKQLTERTFGFFNVLLMASSAED